MIVRKSYPGGRCYLLGELIQDTASRYYYRRHLGAKLALSPVNYPRSTSCHARHARTGSPVSNLHRQKIAPAAHAESARAILLMGTHNWAWCSGIARPNASSSTPNFFLDRRTDWR
jgi:hypothetical protein